jgi:murein L,D-transpeptidase YafK
VAGALLGVALCFCSANAGADNTAQQQPVNGSTGGPETQLIQIVLEIGRGRNDSALKDIDQILLAYPNFRLAHLIKGDLLLSRTQPLTTLGNAHAAPQTPLSDLREEARARFARYRQEHLVDRLPRYLLQLGSGSKHVLVIDIARSRLYVFENRDGAPRYVADYYASSGRNGPDKLRAGDKKTPLGVYHVTNKLPREKLEDLYGAGALPISYPNEWDKRHRRNGHGIWLHGTPSDTYSRPPYSSDGCVVLSNQDIDAVSRHVQAGLTPVIISKNIEWTTADSIDAVRRELADRIESWRQNWENLETKKYLAHYSTAFSAGKQKYSEWVRRKQHINSGKIWIKIKLANVSMFHYPGNDELVVVTFDQNYASNNLTTRTRKRQYWIKENGGWKILYEGAA